MKRIKNVSKVRMKIARLTLKRMRCRNTIKARAISGEIRQLRVALKEHQITVNVHERSLARKRMKRRREGLKYTLTKTIERRLANYAAKVKRVTREGRNISGAVERQRWNIRLRAAKRNVVVYTKALLDARKEEAGVCANMDRNMPWKKKPGLT